MKIGIIGAGFAGLATAKVLTQLGHEVQVFDRAPDVGGVWSASRRYPGVTTQSPRDMYSLSDFPMPKDFPEWPSGEQVQQYLAAYASHFGLDDKISLNTTVTAARPVGDRWSVDTGNDTFVFDRLVIANGVFCEPAMPDLPGRSDFEAAGGRVLAATEFLDVEQARGKSVVVLGYGKSACDVAVEISKVADHTSIIARHLLWKVPRKVAGFLNFKYLLLTRMGEALFRYRYLRGAEKFLHGPGNGIRKNMLNSVESDYKRQFKLKDLDLVPPGSIEAIVKGAIGLVTDGFFDQVRAGAIDVHKECTVLRLLEKDGRPQLELSDGTLLSADLLVCATGFTQGVPFLDPLVEQSLYDERGNFMLYRQILPLNAPGLYFSGYNSSFFSPLNAEMAAVWIGAHLADAVELPAPEQRRQDVVDQLAFMDIAAGGHHCRGTKIIPFSLHNVDEILNDLDLNISARTRASHWLNPVNPKAYRKVTAKLAQRLEQRVS